MGAYSTINITRSTANKYILDKCMVFGVPDETIAQIMNKLLEEKLYTCNIVPDHCDNEDNLIVGDLS